MTETWDRARETKMAYDALRGVSAVGCKGHEASWVSKANIILISQI